MRSRRRRRWDMVWALAAAIVVVVVTGLGAGVGDREHITRMYVEAVLNPDSGHLEVKEAIDYDFGLVPRHGIYRDIPDVVAGQPISVFSRSAPSQVQISEIGSQTRVRIGDPSRTISRLHRYEISFLLDGDAVVDESSRGLAWEAIGTDWTVPIDEVEIVLTVPFGLTDVSCGHTGTFDPADCTLEHLGPGVARVGIDKLSAGTGITLLAGLGSRLDEPGTDAAAGAETGANSALQDPGSGLVPPALLAGLAALLGAIPAAVIIRRAGREQVWIGGAADAAHGPAEPESNEGPGDGGTGLPFELLTETDLSELATTEFESPRGMSAVEGGILTEERVLDRHKTAWLLESAIRDEIDLSGIDTDSPILKLGRAAADPHAAVILGLMFGARSSIDLGSHDPSFQAGWNRLQAELEGWRRHSDHWDPQHRRTRGKAIGGGIIVAVIGLALAFFGSWQANRWGSWLWLAVAGGAAFGFGAAAVIRSWELYVRTPEGSARWLQIESFRRFLHESEAQHVDYAAERGLLRQYTAWAVALDETEAWTEAVAAAVASNPSLRANLGNQIAFAAAASSFSRATGVASTTPSSSGSGGGGGGGGSSGGGGGGGGSW